MRIIVLTVPFFWLILSNAAFAQSSINPSEQTLLTYMIAGFPIVFFLAIAYFIGDYRELFWKRRAFNLAAKTSGKIVRIDTCRKRSKAERKLALFK